MADDAAVAELCGLTGAPPAEARAYLEMAGGDLQRAANLLMDGDPGGGEGPAAAPAGEAEGEAVRAPIPAFEDQIISAQPEAKRRRVQVQAAIEQDSAAMGRRMAFDRPGDSTGSYAENLTEGGGQAINRLFAAPAYNEVAPYHEVIQRAKAEGKWVLVNLQQAELFASHALNRDVWSDDTIAELVTGSCLFWQRDNKSAEGEQFCQYHKCGGSLPHICVIDPRTGRSVKAWAGQKWVKPHEAAECLMAFLDRFSISPTPAAAAAPAAAPAATSVAALAAAPASTPAAAPAAAAVAAAPPAPAVAEAPAAAAPVAPLEPPCVLPEEPPEGEKHLRVSLRLPSGQRVARRFRPGDPLERLFATASALAKEPLGRLELHTQFPRRALRELEGGLEAPLAGAGVAGSVVLASLRPAA